MAKLKIIIIITIILIILASLIGIIIFINLNPNTVLGEGAGSIHDSTSTKLVFEDNSKAIFEYSFSAPGIPRSRDCSSFSSTNIDIFVDSEESSLNLPNYPTGVIDTNVVTGDVEFFGINAITGDDCSGGNTADFEVNNPRAECKLTKLTFGNNDKAKIDCTFKADIESLSGPSHFWGLTSGKARITFLKEVSGGNGEVLECIVSKDCSEGFICLNKQCQESNQLLNPIVIISIVVIAILIIGALFFFLRKK